MELLLTDLTMETVQSLNMWRIGELWSNGQAKYLDNMN